MAHTEKDVSTDVLVVGGGMAGLFAAIAAREKGADVILVDKAYVSKSGGGAYTEAHFAPFNPDWGHDFASRKANAYRASEYLMNQDWFKLHLDNSLARFNDTMAWGAQLKHGYDKTGKPVEEDYGTHTNVIIVARTLLPGARKRALELGVKILDRVMVTDVLKQDGVVAGAVGFDAREGDFYVLKAKATILCMGNVGLKMQQTHNMDYWTGDGHAMGYRAGAEIINKEFGEGGGGWAKYPALPGGPMGGTSHTVNAEGEEFGQKYQYPGKGPGFQKLGPLFETHAGRGPIYADNTNLTPEEEKLFEELQSTSQRPYIAERLGFEVIGKKLELLLSSGGITTQDGANSGVAVNTRCETTIPGLYAAGDNAGTCLSGACYIAIGHALMMASITGHIAGENAAGYARSTQETATDKDATEKLRRTLFAPLERKGGFGAGWILQMLQNTVAPYYILGIKHASRMQGALALVEFINEHLVPRLRADDAHGLRMAVEVGNMGLNAEMVLRSSLFRTESRGVHYREDFPRRDDRDWLAWTVLTKDNGQMRLFKRPIPEEWRPDLSIPYSERYDSRFPGEES